METDKDLALSLKKAAEDLMTKNPEEALNVAEAAKSIWAELDGINLVIHICLAICAKTFYGRLNLQPGVEQELVLSRYKQLVEELEQGVEVHSEAEEALKNIKEAYATLGNQLSRDRYDKELGIGNEVEAEIEERETNRDMDNDKTLFLKKAAKDTLTENPEEAYATLGNAVEVEVKEMIDDREPSVFYRGCRRTPRKRVSFSEVPCSCTILGCRGTACKH